MGIGMIGGMLLFWVVIIALAVLLARALFQTNRSRGTNLELSAHQILEQRYARGEINQEQFHLMQQDIE